MTSSTPSVTSLRVIPVAGRDSMLLNLSGAHGPFFTRNLVLVTDSAGRRGIGEVPGGAAIRSGIGCMVTTARQTCPIRTSTVQRTPSS